jgi:hypothetical protein
MVLISDGFSGYLIKKIEVSFLFGIYLDYFSF